MAFLELNFYLPICFTITKMYLTKKKFIKKMPTTWFLDCRKTGAVEKGHVEAVDFFQWTHPLFIFLLFPPFKYRSFAHCLPSPYIHLSQNSERDWTPSISWTCPPPFNFLLVHKFFQPLRVSFARGVLLASSMTLPNGLELNFLNR